MNYRKHVIGVVIALLSFGVFSFVSADEIVSQTTHSTDSVAVTGSTMTNVQFLGGGFTGNFFSLQMYFRAGSCPLGTCPRAKVWLVEGTSSTFTVASAATVLGTFTPTNTSEQVATFSGVSYTFDPSKYYGIAWDCDSGCGANIYVRGNPANSYAGGDYLSPNPTHDTNIADIYMRLYNDNVDDSSRIVSLDSPIDGEVTSSTLVNFAFTYYSNPADLFTIAGISLVDISAAQSVVGATTTVAGSGQFSASLTRQLASGHQYRWFAYLQKADGTRIQSQSRVFYAAATPSFSSSTASLFPIEQVTDANASSSLQQYAQQFVNTLSAFQGKFPISWLYGTYAIFNSISVSSTSVPTYTADFTAYNASHAGDSMLPDTFTFFSQSVIESWVPYSTWVTIRQVLVYLEWFGFAYWAFGRIKSVTI